MRGWIVRAGSAVIGLCLAPGVAPAQFSNFTITYSSAGASSAGASLSAAGVPSGLTASTVGRTGVTAVAGTNSFDSTGFSTVNAFDPTRFLSFTLNPGGGVLDLNSVSVVVNRDSAGTKNTEVRSSLNNFATTLAGPTSLTPNAAGTVIAASGLTGAFDAIVAPIEFRIYGYDSTQSTGVLNLFNGSTAGQNAVTITGGFNPVPEPATVGLAGAVGLGLLRLARRRRG